MKLDFLKNKNKKGFALLFSVLVSVLVLAIGASMITIALKQIILSGSGRESQFAFYAANTGVECALYWDINGPVIDDGVIKYVFPPPGGDRLDTADMDHVKCSGVNIVTGIGSFIGDQTYTEPWDISGDSTTFRISILNDINDETRSILYCAEVTVDKFEDSGDVITRITSQGLNTCDPEGNNRAVQRGLVLEYES